jgi:coenzyme F420 hydrogenase subunit beta
VAAVNQGSKKGYRRLGVVGTPCQVTAVAQMRSNPLEGTDFCDSVALVVGLFCTWAVDTRKLMALLADRVNGQEIKKMDIPPPPAEVFELQTEREKIIVALDDIRAQVPEGCLICPDMTSEWSDVAVGVLEDQAEWNTVIVRSDKGEELVRKAGREGWLRTKEMPPGSLDHLTFAARNKKSRAVAKAKEDGLLNVITDGHHPALRIQEKVVRKITGVQEE